MFAKGYAGKFAYVLNTCSIHHTIKSRGHVQSSAKRWSPGCVNAAGKARQTKFIKHGDCLIAKPDISYMVDNE